jgi:hypothetical protein
MKYGLPRTDLSVTIDGVRLEAALALGSWVAFMQTAPGVAMAMGDLVLTEDEVAPVMRELQRGGVQQTALHNHLLREQPKLMYMHVAARGNAVSIATAVRRALALTRTPLQPSRGAEPMAVALDTSGIARALGRSGKLAGDVYQVSVPRRERITDSGHEIPPAMGVATSINFQPIGGGRAAVTGDFVLRADEINSVIRALQAHAIQPTAIHSHMITESPRMFFMHFWAIGDAAVLAAGVRAALDQTATRPR